MFARKPDGTTRGEWASRDFTLAAEAATVDKNLYLHPEPESKIPILEMKIKVILTTAAMLATLTTASAIDLSKLPTLRNTGEGLSAGDEDGNYVILGGDDSTVLEPGDPNHPTHPNWVEAPTGSAWITPFDSGRATHPVGNYTYEVTFNLADAGVDHLNFGIFGDWSSDNGSSVQLNDGPLIEHAFKGWDELSSFSFTSGFNAGENVLKFVVNNASGSGQNPTGLLVANLQVVPEPATVLGSLLGLGMVGYMGFRRRKISGLVES